mgnify:CR=1 FL=1
MRSGYAAARQVVQTGVGLLLSFGDAVYARRLTTKLHGQGWGVISATGYVEIGTVGPHLNGVNLNDGTCENMGEIYTVTSVGSGKAILDRVTTGVLEPGVAYIVANNNRDGLTIPNGATFTLDETAGLLDEPIKSAFMQGTFDDTYAPVGSYVLQPDGKFHIVAQAKTIKVGANRAYLNGRPSAEFR